MRYQFAAQEVEQFGVEEEAEFTIAATGKAFHTLISGLYSNKIESIVRETCANAYDGHVARGNLDRPFTIHVPNRWEPFYSVRDYGSSMDHDFVMKLYSTMFWSSKETSDTEVGCFGLGSKSPFAYTNEFALTCWKDGLQRTYTCVIAETGRPKVLLMSTQPSEEEQGVMVSFPVQEADYSAFIHAVRKVALPYRPAFEANIEAPAATVLIETDDFLFVGEQIKGPCVQIGPVWYPINLSEPGLVEALSAPDRESFARADQLVLKAPIGAVAVSPSREMLSYDKKTVASLVKMITDALDYFERRVKQTVSLWSNVWDAAIGYDLYIGTPIERLLMANMDGPNGKSLPSLSKYYVGAESMKNISLLRDVGTLRGRDAHSNYLQREQGRYAIINDALDATPRRVILKRVSFLRQRVQGLTSDAYLITLPDPAEVRKLSARRRKAWDLLPEEKKTPRALFAERAERKQAYGKYWERATTARKELPTLLEGWGCPNIWNAADLPDPPKAPRKPRVEGEHAVAEPKREGITVFKQNRNGVWDATTEYDEDQVLWVVPLAHRRAAFAFDRYWKNAFTALTNGGTLPTIVGVSQSNLARFMRETPNAVLFEHGLKAAVSAEHVRRNLQKLDMALCYRYTGGTKELAGKLQGICKVLKSDTPMSIRSYLKNFKTASTLRKYYETAANAHKHYRDVYEQMFLALTGEKYHQVEEVVPLVNDDSLNQTYPLLDLILNEYRKFDHHSVPYKEREATLAEVRREQICGAAAYIVGLRHIDC